MHFRYEAITQKLKNKAIENTIFPLQSVMILYS